MNVKNQDLKWYGFSGQWYMYILHVHCNNNVQLDALVKCFR